MIDNIKLVDFGSAYHFDPDSKEPLFEMAGAPHYCSPEMLGGKGYDQRTDVWSCGVVFHFLLTGSSPFDGKTDIEIMHRIQTTEINFLGSRYSQCDKGALKLLKSMLSKDPECRITASLAR